ncbi:DUF418 domain-containing protein [Rhodanobacter sp. 7MK24]|uniref:DUF418 domain-containing protein n=1 Tax=Rhodanobacter sp. 7MK24 TaxID=2775922 RepID=UPI00177E5B60|nr:DUF418 domain-containing protein [Rhodanobacter sp. 7MK24]MBD8880251.1 DUF418 domain-containing protein [Rhodanobacter sp. 7MK24]
MTRGRADALPSSIDAAAQPVADKDRIRSIDILRGIALFGVLVVNLVDEFRVSLFQQFLPYQPSALPLEGAIARFISMFLEMKAFALFSILFGVGLAIQFERLARRGPRRRLLIRRLLILLAIGLAHLLLLWNGDILTEYALAGFVVLPFLWVPARAAALAAAGLLTFYAAMPALSLPIAWPSVAWLQHHVVAANHVYATGTYGRIVRFSWAELPYILSLHVYVFPRTLGLFLLGMAAWRTGVLRDPQRHRRLLSAVAGFGLILGTLMGMPDVLRTAAPWLTSAAASACLANAANIFMGLGYAAAVIVLVEFTRASRVLRVFAPLGRMAFTNYLMQSVIFTWVFFGYGLGYFGRMGLAEALVLGVVVYMCQIGLSAVWLRRYRFGPVEWLWRTCMYGARQPMTPSSTARQVSLLR